MSENEANEKTDDLEALARSYLDAFEARDMDRCLGFFWEEASIDFQSGLYKGRKAIEDWHKDRFGANLRVVRIDSVTVNGDTVVINAVVSSNRLAAWKVSSLSGRVTIRFRDGKIQEGKLAPRMVNPINLIRSS